MTLDWNLILLIPAIFGALLYIWKVLRKLVRMADQFEELTSEEGWPNGSKSLKESHTNLYNKVGSVQNEVHKLKEKVDVVEVSVHDMAKTAENRNLAEDEGRSDGRT